MPLRPAPAAAAIAACLVAIAASPGHAQEEPAPTASPPPPRASIGYLGGNGIGELGAELGFRAWPHVAIGLQAGRIAGAAGSGLGLAPLLRVSLFPDGGPYAAVGAAWFTFADATTRVTGAGLLAGLGYEWRPVPRFALLGGVGMAYVPGTTIARGAATSEGAGGLKPNFELGARWYAF